MSIFRAILEFPHLCMACNTSWGGDDYIQKKISKEKTILLWTYKLIEKGLNMVHHDLREDLINHVVEAYGFEFLETSQSPFLWY